VNTAYTYVALSRLLSVLHQAASSTLDGVAYAYDAVGNRLSSPGVPYTYDDAHKMLTCEGVPYTYDANGSTLSKTNGSGTTSYAWDFEKRLTSVTKPDSSVLSFRYDPFGRRISKTSSAGTTTYIYDGDNISDGCFL
jgi:YD repeat-containing protein